MFSIQPAAQRLVLLFPLLASQHTAAAEDASARVLANIDSSGYSSVIQPTSGTNSSTENEIRRLLDLYMDARWAGMLEEADALAKQIVTLSIQAYGRDSMGTAEALTNLAKFQAENDDTVAAIQNLVAAIDIVERVENRLSMELIGPLNDMGAIYYRVGDAALARAVWTRAVHISHVNLGPHNYVQIETLYSIQELFTDAGKSKEANKMRKRISFLQTRDIDLQSSDTLPVDNIQADSVKP